MRKPNSLTYIHICTCICIALAFSLIIWILAVTPQVRANDITANVDIEPDSLLLKEGGYGKWITAYIRLPAGYDVDNINVSSVTLEAMGSHILASRYDFQENVLMVKFDRAMVISFLWSMIDHMFPRVKYEVTLTVTGDLYDDDSFEGSDTIKVFYTHLLNDVIGDVDGNGVVDVYDALILRPAFGSKPADPNWNPDTDLNSDNIIDIYDALILRNHHWDQ